MTIFLSIVSVALAALRIGGFTSSAFQAVAHLWVGGLVGAWLAGDRPSRLWLALMLSAVEVACFLVERFG